MKPDRQSAIIILLVSILSLSYISPSLVVLAEQGGNEEAYIELEEGTTELESDEESLYIESEDHSEEIEEVEEEHNEDASTDEIEVEEEVVLTRDGEEVSIERIPEEIREKLYVPEDGEEIHDPFLFDELMNENNVSTSSSWTWPNNPQWLPHVQEFLNTHASRAQRIANANNLYPSVMLAQAIQESGWGSSSLSTQHNNFFGIKATGYSGGSVNMPTWEWVPDPSHPDGGFAVTIQDDFRSYSSPDESFRDYANFLRNNPNRYRGAFRDQAPSPQHAIRNIHTGAHIGIGGYATDHEYADKVISNIARYDLERLDSGPTVRYRTHVQSRGDLPWVTDGQMSGTSGQRLRMESIQIELDDIADAGIEYQTHVERYGWTDWQRNGARAGTTGEAKRLEGIRIRLTGQAAENFDVYYRVHSEHFGWLDWAKNGEEAGTAGYGYRLESIEIQVVPNGQGIGGRTNAPFRQAPTFVEYSPHVQSHGWLPWHRNGATAGTVGERKRLEAIRFELRNREYSGNVRYRTHVQSDGWQNWVQNGAISGTQGQSKRLEALQLELTGQLANHYDIYYRVHVEHFGWLGWAKNGQSSGTQGRGLSMEAIEVRLVPKNNSAPGTTSRHFIQ